MTALHHDNRVEKKDIKFPSVPAKRVDDQKMLQLRYKGSTKVEMAEVPKVTITDPGDAVVKVTASTICGSDLHLYHAETTGLPEGYTLGHEAIGIVEDVGPECTTFKKGDRVVISAIIACGSCDYCQRKEVSLCERTNPDPEGTQEKLYGHRLSGVFGYSNQLGGFEGCQASHVRVPLADNNLLKIPESLSAEQAILLSDIACTAWHGNELADVQKDDKVVVWGCGPVGLLIAYFAKFRGAKLVVSIDEIPYRLDVAKKHAHADVVIDRSNTDVVKKIQELIPGGPDKCIDASGFRFAHSMAHKVMRAIGLEVDTPEVVNEMITVCRKGGNIALIGDYFGYTNHFNLGAMMEKNLHITGGQLFCQKYWKDILQWMLDGKIDLSWIVTHHMPLRDTAKGYEMFDKKQDNVLKILLTNDDTSDSAAARQ